MQNPTTENVTVEALSKTIKQAVRDGHTDFKRYITHKNRKLKGMTPQGLESLASDFASIGYEVQA